MHLTDPIADMLTRIRNEILQNIQKLKYHFQKLKKV